MECGIIKLRWVMMLPKTVSPICRMSLLWFEAWLWIGHLSLMIFGCLSPERHCDVTRLDVLIVLCSPREVAGSRPLVDNRTNGYNRALQHHSIFWRQANKETSADLGPQYVARGWRPIVCAGDSSWVAGEKETGNNHLLTPRWEFPMTDGLISPNDCMWSAAEHCPIPRCALKIQSPQFCLLSFCRVGPSLLYVQLGGTWDKHGGLCQPATGCGGPIVSHFHVFIFFPPPTV